MKNGVIYVDPLILSIFKQYCEENGYIMKYRLTYLIKEDIGEEKYQELCNENMEDV